MTNLVCTQIMRVECIWIEGTNDGEDVAPGDPFAIKFDIPISYFSVV